MQIVPKSRLYFRMARSFGYGEFGSAASPSIDFWLRSCHHSCASNGGVDHWGKRRVRCRSVHSWVIALPTLLYIIDCIQEPIDSIAISNFSHIAQCPQQIPNIVQILIQLTLIKLTGSCTEKHSHGNAIQIPFPLSRSEAMPFSLSAKERRNLHRVRETMSHPDLIIYRTS